MYSVYQMLKGLAEIKDKSSWWDEFVQCEKES